MADNEFADVRKRLADAATVNTYRLGSLAARLMPGPMAAGAAASLGFGASFAVLQQSDADAALPHGVWQPGRYPHIVSHVAVARQQHGTARRVLVQQPRHELVARDLRRRHAARLRFVQHAAVAREDRVGLVRRDRGRHHGIEAGGRQPFLSNKPRVGTRHVCREQRQAVLERKRDERAVQRPGPAGALRAGRLDHVVGRRAGLRHQPVDVDLALTVELLHQQGR